MTSGIYVFENKVNGKKYIGKSYNIERRILHHINLLKKNKEDSPILNNAVSKYGIDNFDIYTLEECDAASLSEREKYYIKIHGTHGKNGYNATDGGEGMMGYKHTTESKKKISESKLGEKHPYFGKKLPESHRKKMGRSGEKHPNFGKQMSDEQKSKISKAHFGKVLSEQTKQKISVKSRKLSELGMKRKTAASKYLGVSKDGIYWISIVTYNTKRKYIGRFADEIEAAKAHDKYVLENNIKRPLNFLEI